MTSPMRKHRIEAELGFAVRLNKDHCLGSRRPVGAKTHSVVETRLVLLVLAKPGGIDLPQRALHLAGHSEVVRVYYLRDVRPYPKRCYWPGVISIVADGVDTRIYSVRSL